MKARIPNYPIHIYPTFDDAKKMADQQEKDEDTIYTPIPRESGGFLVLVSIDMEEVGFL